MTYVTQHNGAHNPASNGAENGGAAGGGIEQAAGAAGGRAAEGGAGGVARDGGGGCVITGSGGAEFAAKEYPEPMVARTVGLSRSRLKQLRQAHLGEDDWALVNSVVTYSAQALEKMLASAGLRAGDFRWPTPPGRPGVAAGESGGTAAAGDPAAQAVSVPPLCELRVVNLCGNPILVFAEGPGAEGVVRVRVRSNVNFMRGMLLKARAPQSPGGLWHHEGACPRFKGRY